MNKATTLSVTLLLLAACGDSTSGGDASTSPQETASTTTTQAQTTTAAPVPSTVTPTIEFVGGLPEAVGGSLETMLVEDLVFHPEDDRLMPLSGLVDVIAPTTEGPWPTVVVFHGAGGTNDWHSRDASMLAERGRVVFLPNWMQFDQTWWDENGTRAGWELMGQEATCALVYAKAHAADYGGDPDRVTVYGYSAGGNGALMASLAELTPIDACSEPGSAVVPQAVVAIDADWLLAPAQWDEDLSGDPELFYVMTPYRYLDGSRGIPIHTMSTENTTAPFFARLVPDDPAESWFGYRHADVDLAAELEELGFLDDGKVDVQEYAKYGFLSLTEHAYESSYSVMPNSSHANWSDEARAAVVERVLHAESGVCNEAVDNDCGHIRATGGVRR